MCKLDRYETLKLMLLMDTHDKKNLDSGFGNQSRMMIAQNFNKAINIELSFQINDVYLIRLELVF